MKLAILAVAIGISATVVADDKKSLAIDAKLQEARDKARANLVHAIAARDVPAFLAEVRLPVAVSGIPSDSEACRSFGGSVAIDKKALPAFVACLAALEVETGPHDFAYGAGLEIEATFDQSTVTALSWTGRISSHWLWRHQLTRKPLPVDAATKRLAKRGDVGAMIDICVDDAGKVQSATVIAQTDGAEAWARRGAETIRRWKYRPVRVRKTMTAVAVCAREVFAFPAARRFAVASTLGYSHPEDYFFDRDESFVVDPYESR